MSPLRFLVAFAVSAVAAATVSVAVIALIDPLGVVPASPSLYGVNAKKVMRFNNDRIYKPLDLLSARPRTVVLGTSRILQAFDPGTLSGTPYEPAYNYGLAGGDLDELEAHFERFIAPTPSVEHVFVELFLPRALARSQRPAPSTSELMAATFFSWSALQQSAETVWQNVQARRGLAAPGPVILADGRQSFVEMSTLGNFLAYPAGLLRARPGPRPELDAMLGSLRRMRDTARRRRIALTFFVSPMHAVQLYGLHLAGQWPLLEAWKSALAREFDVLDFSAYSPVTVEPVSNEMQYWADPHHFSRRTATLLAGRLVRRAAAPPDDFGRPLSADRLDDELRAARDSRDAWIARNPGWAELFRLAREGVDTNLPTLDSLPGGQQCPVRVADALSSRLPPSRAGRLWVVMSSRTTLDPPIVVRVRSVGPAEHGGEETCELTIDAAPAAPSVRSVDWRIGHPLGSPAALRDRTVRYTLRVRASAPVTLNTGTVYVHDGARTSAAPVTRLTRDWHTVTVDHLVSPQASRLEVWFRLVVGRGTVHPPGARIYLDAAVDLVAEPHRASRSPSLAYETTAHERLRHGPGIELHPPQ